MAGVFSGSLNGEYNTRQIRVDRICITLSRMGLVPEVGPKISCLAKSAKVDAPHKNRCFVSGKMTAAFHVCTNPVRNCTKFRDNSPTLDFVRGPMIDS